MNPFNNKKRFFGLQLKHDLMCGCFKSVYKLIPFVIIIVIGYYSFFTDVENMFKIGKLSTKLPSFMDSMLYFFRGVKAQDIALGRDFPIPIMWLWIQIYTLFSIGSYPSDDLSGYGIQSIIRTSKKEYWLAGKYFYCFVQVLINYLAVIAVVFCLSSIHGTEFFVIHKELLFDFFEIENDLTFKEVLINSFLLPLFTSVIVSFIYSTLMLKIKPIIAFVIVAAYQIFAVFVKSPLLIGNFSMIMRSSSVLGENGFSSFFALVIESVLLFLTCVSGVFLIKRTDFIEKS